MTTFLILFTISFSFLLLCLLILSYAKRKQNATRHHLTGICHETGSTMCCSCSQAMQNLPAQTKDHEKCSKNEPQHPH